MIEAHGFEKTIYILSAINDCQILLEDTFLIYIHMFGVNILERHFFVNSFFFFVLVFLYCFYIKIDFILEQIIVSFDWIFLPVLFP